MNMLYKTLGIEEDILAFGERIIEELKRINPIEMTPIEALNKLYELTNELKKEN